MEDYGIKISKDGKSIESTDPADYIFWSKYHSRTILIQGSTTILCANNATTKLTITHNLGYIPQVALFSDTSGGYNMKIPWELFNPVTGYDESVRIVNMFTDRIEINFNRFITGASYTYTVNYLIFMEKII